MLFNSAGFAVFLPVMLAVYWSLRGAWRGRALLAGSYLFYAWWDWRFLGLLLLTTSVAYAAALWMARCEQPSARRRILAAGIIIHLATLGAFKYFDFFRDTLIQSVAAFGIDLDLPLWHVILPMGISFYTFQAMAYTVDVYRGMAPERNLSRFALFISCFPQLVAGPIMRARDFLPQLSREPQIDASDVSTGVYRIFRGLFKKMIVADTLALYVDMVFAAPEGFTGLSAWIALYAYAFQIYMDFSGYCDVAVGVGRLLGITLSENFDRPYLSCSPSEFWRRWHMTLSTWLRDYLYIPLGGSRLGKILTVRNLFITMVLGGLWHGAAWTFAAWGLYHALLLIGERWLCGGKRRVEPAAMPIPTRILHMLLMFHLVCLGWLLFRSPDWSTAVTMLGNLVDFSAHEVYGLRIAGLVAVCMAVHSFEIFQGLGERFARISAVGQGALAASCMWVLLIGGPKSQSFIYFQF